MIPATSTRALQPGRLAARGAALVAVSLWASAFVGIRSAGHELDPGPLALGRLLVGSVALGGVLAARREGLPPRRALPGIALSGLLWFGLYGVLLNEAERRVDAGTASMLVNLGPIVIAALAGALLGEGFPPRLLAGSVVAFAGVATIGLTTARHGVGTGWGAALCVAAAFAYAGGAVAQKPALRSASPLQVTWLACTVGAVACLPYLPALERELGLRPRPDGCRAAGGRHLPRAAAGRPARVGAPRRDAAAPRPPRRRALPRRRRVR